MRGATAEGVFGTRTGTGWPDIIVAGVMASLALSGPVRLSVTRLAR